MSDKHECSDADIVAIDEMQLVEKISNPASVKNFKELADVFCQGVEKLMGSCRVVLIAFDVYYDISLKNSTRSGRLGNAIPVEFTVDDTFDISDTSLKEILSHTRTKKQLTYFNPKKLQTYLEEKDTDFVIAGNGSTVMSWGEKFNNNHEEADSFIAHIIKLALEQVFCIDMPL